MQIKHTPYYFIHYDSTILVLRLGYNWCDKPTLTIFTTRLKSSGIVSLSLPPFRCNKAIRPLDMEVHNMFDFWNGTSSSLEEEGFHLVSPFFSFSPSMMIVIQLCQLYINSKSKFLFPNKWIQVNSRMWFIHHSFQRQHVHSVCICTWNLRAKRIIYECKRQQRPAKG